MTQCSHSSKSSLLILTIQGVDQGRNRGRADPRQSECITGMERAVGQVERQARNFANRFIPQCAESVHAPLLHLARVCPSLGNMQSLEAVTFKKSADHHLRRSALV